MIGLKRQYHIRRDEIDGAPLQASGETRCIPGLNGLVFGAEYAIDFGVSNVNSLCTRAILQPQLVGPPTDIDELHALARHKRLLLVNDDDIGGQVISMCEAVRGTQ